MNMFLVLGAILCLLCVILILVDEDQFTKTAIFVLAYIGSGFIMAGFDANKPTALDVYQGKTTLEITYIDGLAVDSVVVFKRKETKETNL